MALYQFLSSGWAAPGEFMINVGWFSMEEFALLRDFHNYAKTAPSDWTWWNYLGQREALDDQVARLCEQLKQVWALR